MRNLAAFRVGLSGWILYSQVYYGNIQQGQPILYLDAPIGMVDPHFLDGCLFGIREGGVINIK